MAEPISFVPPERNGSSADQHLREATQAHSEAIQSALDLLQLLHDRGILDLLRGAVGAGDQLMEILTAAVNTPEAIRGIRNLVVLTKFLASIPPDVLNGVVQTAGESMKREKEQPAPSLFQLFRRLNSKSSRHALAVTLDLLESVAKGS
jgi:uncharacterized protein YjgD (DUF1641 family)